MQQLDFFRENEVDYLFGEVSKLQNSTDKTRRAIFAHLSELQSQIIELKNNQQQT